MIELAERLVRGYFEHRVATYAAALAYRGLFGLFPFMLILVVLVSALGSPDSFDQLIEEAESQSAKQVPHHIKPMVEQGKGQIEPLTEEMIEQAQKRARGEFLFFGIALALWSVSALASTLADAFNTAYDVTETRRWWKVRVLSLISGPILALVVIFSVALMLIGPQLVGSIAELVDLDDFFVHLWGWMRFPVALFLLAVVLSVVYRFGPNVELRFRSVVVGATLAVILWAISSVGFSFYLANFADYGATYGSLGVAVGLLFYLYLSASVVLLGAEVNATIYHLGKDGTTEAKASESSYDETTDVQRKDV